MPRLEDFSSDSQVNLEELAPVKQKTIINSIPSNRNKAAFTAALSDPDKAESNFRSVISETDESLLSSTSQNVLETSQRQNTELSTKALSDFVASPNVDIATKQQAVSTFQQQLVEQNKEQNLVGMKFAMKDSPGESGESQKIRDLSAIAIQNATRYNDTVQGILNAEEAKFDNNLSDDVLALAEIFAPFVADANFSAAIDEIKGGEGTSSPMEVLLAGSTKNDFRKAFQEMDLDERLGVTESLINILNKHSGVVLSDSNRFLAADQLRTVLEDGYYDDSDAFMDNVFSILDHTIIGGLVSRSVKAIDSLGSLVKIRRVKSPVQPSSVSQVLKETNPSSARELFEAAAYDEDIAQAAYGAKSVDVVANDLLPDFSEVSYNKVGNMASLGDGPAIKDQNLSEFISRNDGAIHLTVAEKRNAVDNVVNDFRNAAGMTVRDEMSLIKTDGNDLIIRSVYGPEEGGFLDPQEAIETALFSLRNMGVKREDLVLLKNIDGNRVPVVPFTEEAGDYLVAIDSRHKLSENVTEYEPLDVKRNWLDRFGFGTKDQGTLQSHLIDNHSALHPNITFGANVQVDKATGLESILSGSTEVFQEGYAKLPKGRRRHMESFIIEANDKGIDFNPVTLKANGFNDDEMKLLGNWREYWDAHYWLENGDQIKTLRTRGFKVLEDTGEKHFARPLAQRNFQTSQNVFDTATGKIEHLNLDQIDQLYKSGGTLAEFRRPLITGGKKADYIISRESRNGPYLRGLNDTDQVVTYRKGYYQVQYKNPVFIEKIIKDSSGNILGKRAVATADNIKDGKLTAKRLQATDPDGHEYVFRPDNKKMRSDSDEAWDLQVARGRSAQMHRGDRLEHASGSMDTGANILDPMESLNRSIRSVSRRVSMRDWLENTQARFLQQYAEHLPKDKYGQARMPNNKNEIAGGKFVTGDIADARTTFEYIRYMQDGYSNSIDDTYKAIMIGMANILGEKTSTGEEIFRGLSDANPTQLAKGISFKLYLAANPLRQFIVQGHQAARLTVLFPKYTISGKMANQMLVLGATLRDIPTNKLWLKSAGLTKFEVDQMAKDWRMSGLSQAVDSNNLVRGDLKALADVSIMDRAKSLVGAPFNLMQRAGFDLGEQMNVMTAWLAYRDEAKQAGKVFTSDVRDEIVAKARNITYNMNAAGDMPYNQNFLNVAMQFMQVPHKALLQNLTNRGLSRSERAKLLVQDTVMWGIPAGAITAIFGEVLPDDPELRKNLEAGLEDVALNKLLELSLGQEVDINFTDSLAPGNILGLGEMMKNIATSDVGTILANSPAGQMWFGGNPRITNLANTTARYFNFVDDYQDPTEFSNVATSMAGTMSGMSNTWKALYALKYGEKISSMYDITDYKVTSPEAIAQAFGFRTWDEVQKQAVKKELYEGDLQSSDIRNWYTEFKLHMGRKGITDRESEFIAKTFNEALRVFGPFNREAQGEIEKLISRDIKNNDDVLFQSILKKSGVIGYDKLLRLAEDSGLEDEQRQILVDAINHMNEYNGTEQ